MKERKLRTVYYYGYLVDENGNIYNKHGHKMTPYYTNTGNYVIALRINSKRVIKRVARVLYEAFHPEEDLTNKIVRSLRIDSYLNIDDLYLDEVVPGGNPKTKEYKSHKYRNKQEVLDKYNELKKHPLKYRKEIDILKWVLKEKD